jgi:energy-coupling factor transporter ATP-binding protein EcfA2
MNDVSALAVRGLSFRYRDRSRWALKDISLELQAGKLMLAAGPSGCGKTTLARCINGLIPRSYKGEMTGSIEVCGQDTSEMSLAQISQSVGTILQDPERQILGTKVINEVAFGLENLGLPREEIRERALAAMSRLGITELRERETFRLSGGEKQKVALAGVLAMEPRVLMLDEPLASLDPASAKEALHMVRDLVDQGMAILIVEHRVEDVLKIRPDVALFLREGEITYHGSIQGMMESVDYHEVKLPAALVMERAANDPPGPEKLASQRKRPQDAPPLVEFQEVSFSYEEGVPVLRDVSLQVWAGDVLAVLGPNGAGKTTLVKHAIGLLKPQAGDVRVAGRSTRELSVAEVAKTLGYVFQSPSHMLFAPTVTEELAFGPKNLGHGTQEIGKEVAGAIEIMNLSGMEEDPPLALSFGQQKRVSIAAILAMGSTILVMDEPTAGQDYRNYMDFMDSILQLPSFASILFITHDIDLAVVYANRILLMDQGRIVADGSSEEVLGDVERLERSRLIPTSLLEANLKMFDRTGTFLRAEALAHIPSELNQG